ASLALESVPARWRGFASGLLQAGYPSGYLLAALFYWAAFPLVSWRGMFMIGALPALLVLYIRRRVPESPEWQPGLPEPGHVAIARVVRRDAGLAFFAILLMTAFNFFGHGAQDLYPTFLSLQMKLSAGEVAAIVVVNNIGAILGGIVFGVLSQRIGRRAGI